MATASGSLIFGLGTRSNNALGSAVVFAVSPTTRIHPDDNHFSW